MLKSLIVFTKRNRRLNQSWRHWLFFCVIALVSLFFVYGRSLQFFFWNEDFYLLEFVDQEPLSEYVRLSFTKTTEKVPLNLGAVFRPLSHYVYFKVTHLLFAVNPLPYRLLNISWHFLNGVLVAVYCYMICRKPSVGFVAGVLLVINRVYFTPVYWISANNEIALTCFVLLSVIGYLQALDRAGKGGIYFGISGVSLVLALLSKESAVVLPALVALSVFLRLDGKSFQDRLFACRRLWPQVLIVFVFLGIRAPLIMHALTGESSSYSITNLVKLVSSYLWGLWWNLETFVEPWRMILDGLTQSFSLFQPLYLSTVGVILAVAGAIWLVKTNDKANVANPIWLGLAWFFFSAFPALATGILTAYLFSLPAVGFVIAVAYLAEFIIARVCRESIVKKRLFFVIFLVLSVASARLVVLSLEKTTWPVKHMPLTVKTLEIAQQQFSNSDQTVCLVDFPADNWWAEEDLQAAFHVFVGPEINARKLTAAELDDGKCPPGAPQLRYINNEIIVYQPSVEG